MSYNSAITDASLLALWPLDDDAASTVVLDSSGNVENGTLYGAGNTSGSSVAGPTGKGWLSGGLEFDGTDDYVLLPETNLKPDNITIIAWVKGDGANGSLAAVIACDDGSVNDYGLVYKDNGTNKLVGQYNSSPRQTLQEVASLSGWNHVALTYDGTIGRLYLNGVEVDSSSAGTGNVAYPGVQSIRIADDETTGGNFAGDIAQVGIYDTALSAVDIANIYSGPEPLNTIAPTLTISTTTWSGTIGSWDAQGNGTISYAWELHDADDDSMVESGTGSSPSGSGSYSGNYYLWVRASNDGGYDSGEDSVSSDETASGGGGSNYDLTNADSQVTPASVISSLTATFPLAVAGSSAGVFSEPNNKIWRNSGHRART